MLFARAPKIRRSADLTEYPLRRGIPFCSAKDEFSIIDKDVRRL